MCSHVSLGTEKGHKGTILAIAGLLLKNSIEVTIMGTHSTY